MGHDRLRARRWTRYTGSVSDRTETSPRISEAEVRRLARLARLELDEAQVAVLSGHLDAIVRYVERLRALDLSGVAPMTHPGDDPAPLADDVPGPALPLETVMRLAPDTFPPFIRVPRVFEEGNT